MRALVVLLVGLALGGCSILFPEDWRVGEESVDACVARLNADIDLFDFRELADTPEPLIPTYTYDITKLPFERTQELIVPGSDETLGSRLMKQTNRASTAMTRFMETEVDEKGAFFFGVDPALYRVRGETMMHADILKAGCEKQQSDMRLRRVNVTPFVPEPVECIPPEEAASRETEDEDGPPICPPKDETDD